MIGLRFFLSLAGLLLFAVSAASLIAQAAFMAWQIEALRFVDNLYGWLVVAFLAVLLCRQGVIWLQRRDSSG